jgi:hypothetical protein
MMRNKIAILVPALLAVALLGAYAPAAYAGNESAMFVKSGLTANAEHWINLLTPDFSSCLGGAIDYPQNTVFFVTEGWGISQWTQLAGKGQAGLASAATTFTFLIDGTPQMQSVMWQYNYLGIPDFMVKLFSSEYNNGLTGSHIFTGQFYLDASLFGGHVGDSVLVTECNTTVNFTG